MKKQTIGILLNFIGFLSTFLFCRFSSWVKYDEDTFALAFGACCCFKYFCNITSEISSFIEDKRKEKEVIKEFENA